MIPLFAIKHGCSSPLNSKTKFPTACLGFFACVFIPPHADFHFDQCFEVISPNSPWCPLPLTRFTVPLPSPPFSAVKSPSHFSHLYLIHRPGHWNAERASIVSLFTGSVDLYPTPAVPWDYPKLGAKQKKNHSCGQEIATTQTDSLGY